MARSFIKHFGRLSKRRIQKIAKSKEVMGKKPLSSTSSLSHQYTKISQSPFKSSKSENERQEQTLWSCWSRRLLFCPTDGLALSSSHPKWMVEGGREPGQMMILVRPFYTQRVFHFFFTPNGIIKIDRHVIEVCIFNVRWQQL